MPKILVIDDEESVRQSITFLASLDGWTSFDCDQFGEPERILGENQIDVLILDFNMPPTNGLEILQRIRNAGHKIPTFMLSGYVPDIDRSLAEKLEVKKIIMKPPDISEIRDALRGVSGSASELM